MSAGASETRRGMLVLGAACLLCLLLGSVHAFSVFLEPLESRFAAPRSAVSLTYSFALVTLTLAVLIGHRVFERVPAALLVSAICLVAASGAVVAGFAGSLGGVWIGYSLLFGGANGFGYAFGLQSAALANPGREGFAMGTVTASYALGAAASPVLFDEAVSAGGFRMAMFGLAVALVLIVPVCALAMRSARVAFPARQSGTEASTDRGQIFLLWIGYGTGVAAGLMAIGHAAGIADAAGWRGANWVMPTLIALFNMGGSFSGGWLADRIPPTRLLIGLPLLSAVALATLAGLGGSVATLVGLSIVGFSYGAIIAVFPATIAKMFGTAEGARVYGKVFTAWGTAGLLAPWFAGLLYDRTGGYAVALVSAAALGVLSAIAATLLSRRSDRSS